MKTLKYILLAIVALAGFAACSDDDTETPSGINGYGVYFSVDAPSKIEIVNGQSVVYVPVKRSISTGALSTRVLFTPEEASMGIFTVNPNVEFADGESTAQVEISFNFRDLDISVPYPMTLSLADGNHSTAYGAAQYTFSIIYDPWTPLAEPAIWREDIINLAFNVTGFPETEVEISESPITKGVYRLKNVYSPEFVGTMLGISPAAVAGCCREGYIVVNASNPDKVWIEVSDIGLNFDALAGTTFGWMKIASYCQEAGFRGENYGTLKNGVITFPQDGLLLYVGEQYQWQITNGSGRTRIVLPGGNPLDPIVDVTFEGIFTNVEGENTAIFNAEMNDDAASFRWALVNENIEGDTDAIEAVKSGIVDGSIDSEVVAQSGSFNVPIENAGEYTLVLVPYSADGKTAGNATAVTFEFVSGGSSAADFTAEITVSGIDETWADVSITPSANNLLYYWDCLPTAKYDEILKDPKYTSIGDYFQEYFNEMIEYYAQQNVTLTMSDVVEVFASKGPVEKVELDGLTAGTEYTVFAYCINKSTGAPRSAVTVTTFSTNAMAPMDPDYEAWLGTWTVTSTKTEMTPTPQTFDITLAPLKSNKGYTMTGWGVGPLNSVKLTVIWEKNKETGKALIGILEQLTKTQQNTSYGLGTVAFFARGEFDGEYACWGGNEVALLGALTDNTNGKLVCGMAEENGKQYQFTGADYFVYIPNTGILGYLEDFAVGPFTLVKKAEAASMSAKGSNRVESCRSKTFFRTNITPRMERAMFLKRVNLVEIR